MAQTAPGQAAQQPSEGLEACTAVQRVAAEVQRREALAVLGTAPALEAKMPPLEKKAGSSFR